MLSLFNICINPVNSKQEKKKNVYFDEFFSRNICKNKKCPYLCTRNRETYYSRQQKLFYGVMVTRQILVLKFQVRALVEQQKGLKFNFKPFFISPYSFSFPHLKPMRSSSWMRSLLSLPLLLR